MSPSRTTATPTIVVGAGVESVHSVLWRVTRGQQQDRRANASSSHSFNDFHPRALGHPPVENRDLVLARPQRGLGHDAVNGRINRVTCFSQTPLEDVAKGPIIFSDENSHDPPRYVRASTCRTRRRSTVPGMRCGWERR